MENNLDMSNLCSRARIKTVLVGGALRGGDGDLRDCRYCGVLCGVWKGKHTPQEPAQVQVPRRRHRHVIASRYSDRLNHLRARNPN